MELHHFVNGVIGAMDVLDLWALFSTILRYAANILNQVTFVNL
jgi:hypothetical protein